MVIWSNRIQTGCHIARKVHCSISSQNTATDTHSFWNISSRTLYRDKYLTTDLCTLYNLYLIYNQRGILFLLFLTLQSSPHLITHSKVLFPGKKVSFTLDFVNPQFLKLISTPLDGLKNQNSSHAHVMYFMSYLGQI